MMTTTTLSPRTSLRRGAQAKVHNAVRSLVSFTAPVTMNLGGDSDGDAEGTSSPKPDPHGWTIPSKNKDRLPLEPTTDVSRSAPELQRLAPEDDDGHIEYKVYKHIPCMIIGTSLVSRGS